MHHFKELPFTINDTTSLTYTWKFLLPSQMWTKNFLRVRGNYENLHFGSIMQLLSAKAFRALLKDLERRPSTSSNFHSPPPQQDYWQPHEFTTILKYWFSSGPQGSSQTHAEFQTSVPVSSGFPKGVLCPHLIQLHLTEYSMLTLGGEHLSQWFTYL